MRPSVKGLANALLETLPGPARRPARRAYYARLLRAAREDAQVDLSFLKRVVRRGDCVVDAGASIGLYTKFLSALVGPEGLVCSVEPMPETYDVLVSNVRRLGLSNVRPLNYALSDVDGELEMEVPRWSYGGENLYEARVAGAASGGLRRIRVAARRLDTLVPDRPIAFVKCDVEGHELRCLAGAAETIRRWRPPWLLEVWGDPDAEASHARRVFLDMLGLGYSAHCYDGRRLAPRAGGRRSDNYWFLTAEQARCVGADGPRGGCGRVAAAMPICIAGMHRAGTSMVARMLEGCGVDLGGPANFAPPAPDNRDGYWEDLRFVALNDRILEKFQGAWDHPPVLPPGWETSASLDTERRDAEAVLRWRAEPWGWKDPRNSLTIPFWRSLLPAMRVVICLRNPFEVADSLRARGYTSERFGLSLWEAYHRALEETVDGSFGLVTHYESFLADPEAELDRVLAFLGLQPSPAVRKAVVASALPGARHQRRSSAEAEAATWSAGGPALYAALRERSGPVYQEVRRRERAAAAPSPAPPEQARPRSPAEQLEEVLAVLDARERELASIKPVLVARDEEVEALKALVAAREEQLTSLTKALAARDRLPGSLKGVLKAIKRLVVPAR
jgi:FkbM family methyltransferase